MVDIDSFTTYYDPAVKRRNIERLMSSGSFRLVEGSLREVDLNAFVAGMDVVHRLAAQPGIRRSWEREFEIYLDENLLAMQQLLEAVRDADVERFVARVRAANRAQGRTVRADCRADLAVAGSGAWMT